MITPWVPNQVWDEGSWSEKTSLVPDQPLPVRDKAWW